MFKEKENLWKSVLAEIQLNVSDASFNTWFKNTNIFEIKKDIVIISVPSTFVRDWIQNRYHKKILETVKEINKSIKKIEYIINPNSLPSVFNNKNSFNEKQVENSENQMKFPEMTIDSETGLNPKYNFDNFVVGPFNELAHAAGSAVSENPGSLYNPFFIYSKTGLGKTHLIQAIGNKIKSNFQGKKVLYIQAQKFISEIISSIRNNKMDDFKYRYKDIDVLIIDDIQFLSNKEKTQEEFFHTFNNLYEKNKQIILSSDRPPRSISSLADRLRSRFEGGMIVDIGNPDTDTRAAILKTKAEEKDFYIPNDVCYFIADNIQRSIRELEGVLNKLIIKQQIAKNPVDINTAKAVLDNINQSNQANFSFDKIIKAVTNFYDINEKDVMGSSRKKEIAKSRQIIIYFLRKELNYSYPYIGKKIGGKDHTTVIYSFSKIEKEIKINNEIKEEILHIRESLFSM
ncbi:MAG: chromosomal replication initiator protein DnaA [Patescibacteria group bacterium]|nr:chromosomal replication initiator protein DnaA [Patescibacteria group bacterium]